MAVDSQLTTRVQTAVDEALGDDVERTLSAIDDGYRLTLSDREIQFFEHDAAETSRWVLVLSTDGEIVSKFGPYESTDALVDQLRTILSSDVFYTVCCDG